MSAADQPVELLEPTVAQSKPRVVISWGQRLSRFWHNLGKAALLSIWTHPMRSLLTGLGVFIGVVSVVWLLAIGEGIAEKAEGEIMALGANNLILSSKRPPESERKSKGSTIFIPMALPPMT